MQRIASSVQCASYAGVSVSEYFRRITCIHMQGLHTSMAQLKKLPADMSESDVDEDMRAFGDDEIPISESSTSGSDSEYSPTHAEAEATAGADTAEGSAPAAAASHSSYLGLDDPQLNIYLQYNTQFMTDPDRAYAIGQINALDKETRLELRKALAAHRLHLKDAAAAAGGRRQPSMSQQMNSRLADMQSYLSSSR